MFNRMQGEKHRPGFDAPGRYRGSARWVCLSGALVLSALGCTAAHAGHYQLISSQGGVLTASGGSAPAGALPQVHYGETGGTAASLSYGTGDPTKPATITASGTISTTYQWVPLYAGEPPAGVTVIETVAVAASGSAYFDAKGNCTLENTVNTDLWWPVGLPINPMYAPQTIPLKQIGYTFFGSSAKSVTYYHNGENPLIIHRSPSASVTTSYGPISVSVSGSIELKYDQSTALNTPARRPAAPGAIRVAQRHQDRTRRITGRPSTATMVVSQRVPSSASAKTPAS